MENILYFNPARQSFDEYKPDGFDYGVKHFTGDGEPMPGQA